ncbi:MAG TPA: two-component sensor histidine kinase, partial [Desulfobacteraceae bacterium]|nr:two-component sensor histidine kinase [Desulfobacteraceae bacterium]
SSGIAHELNNPLNNISLSADMLLEEYDDIPKDEAREILRDILAQTDRAGNIVRDLLDFTRDKKPTIRKLRICDVIAGAKKLIENELRLKAVHLETWKQPDLPYILGDEQKLQQVFLNLFVNAIHAMPDGGLIHVDTHAGPEGFIRVDVSDTGAGIPQEKISNIFDPFFTTRRGGTGTGLGLSIVYEIVKKHGGYIEVESQVQAGTTFSIFLPVATEAKDENGKQV